MSDIMPEAPIKRGCRIQQLSRPDLAAPMIGSKPNGVACTTLGCNLTDRCLINGVDILPRMSNQEEYRNSSSKSNKMEPQKNTLRHITIFTVPAGTPVPISGPAYLGRYIKASSIQHWGIYVETEEDVESRQGLCVELGRSSGGGIIVLHRTRQRREETEPQGGIKYEKTGKFTTWDNESIVQCDMSLTVVEISRISTSVTDCC